MRGAAQRWAPQRLHGAWCKFRRLLVAVDHGFYKSPTLWEVERVAISMSNNAEEAIQARVHDGSITTAEASSFLASDTVQLHAKRWRRLSKQTRKVTEMSVQEALLGVEEMENTRLWPDTCTLSMQCFLFSRWRPDSARTVAATTTRDMCVSVVDCPPASERTAKQAEAGGDSPAGGGSGEGGVDAEQYYLVDTHAFVLDVEKDVQSRIIHTLRQRQEEALIVNSAQTMGAWVHANETSVQFNLTSLMVCVPQADLMRWAQPRRTLEEVAGQQVQVYKDRIRAHLSSGGILRPRRGLHGERVVEAMFCLDDGNEVCADPNRPGVFAPDLPQRNSWGGLEDASKDAAAASRVPKGAKLFPAAALDSAGPKAGKAPGAHHTSVDAEEGTAPAPTSEGSAMEEGGEPGPPAPTPAEEPRPLSKSPALPSQSMLAQAFGPSLEDQRLLLAQRRLARFPFTASGMGFGQSYAASMGLDIDTSGSVRLPHGMALGHAMSDPGPEASSPIALPQSPSSPSGAGHLSSPLPSGAGASPSPGGIGSAHAHVGESSLATLGMGDLSSQASLLADGGLGGGTGGQLLQTRSRSSE